VHLIIITIDGSHEHLYCLWMPYQNNKTKKLTKKGVKLWQI